MHSYAETETYTPTQLDAHKHAAKSPCLTPFINKTYLNNLACVQ